MTEEEWRAFVSAGTRTGKLATVNADGRPHVAPVWFLLDDDGTIVFTTGAATLKGRAIARDPRVCLCVDDEAAPYSYVMVHGTASASTDLDDMLEWATRIGSRYMGAHLSEQYGRRNTADTELLVRVTPTKVVARAGVAD
ncbi:MAG TPA: PPOX class F420-dependent oxidoreductase [Acidimicrobiales bacterium]|nr:PPOX class F420-dependent oxidoreductase [Acidimicrobiales bacterium]